MRWIVAHWGDGKRHVFERIGQSLKQMGHDLTWLSRSDAGDRSALLAAIQSDEVQGLLTWQRFFPMQAEIIGALKDSQIQTVYMDYGFFPHYESVVFDAKGENACSTISNGVQANALSPLERQCALLAPAFAQALLPQWNTYESVPPELDAVQAPFVFVPLQRHLDSVVRFDSSVHDFGAFVRKVLYLARGRQFVVIKTHPLDMDLDLGIADYVAGSHVVLRFGNGARNEAACDWLLRNSALVIGVNTSMFFRAMLCDKPIIALGRGWYSGWSVLHEVAGTGDLTSLAVPFVDRGARINYMTTCLERQLLIDDLTDADAVASLFERIRLQPQL